MHRCSKCGKCFPLQETLMQHVKDCGKVPGGFRCPYCDNRGKNTSLIYAHIQKMHPGEEVYILDDF